MRWIVLLLIGGVLVVQALAQQPPATPPPVVIGRDLREPGQVIGKQFRIRIWLSNAGGPGVQKIYETRLAEDGNITLPGVGTIRAEGVPIAQLEAAVAAPLKGISPTASAWVSILDRNPPPAPPPATTQAVTQPATTKPTTKKT